MRCITAICAAGPPKLRSATRIQTRTPSAKETPCAGTDDSIALFAASCDMAFNRRSLGSVCAVAVRLALPNHLPTVGVERVVDDPFGRVLCVVILEAEVAEALGNCLKAGSFTRLID